MGFASHYMTYSVPSTSTWCHLGGSYMHILYVFVPFCKMKACIILCCMIVLVLLTFSRTQQTDSGKDITSLAKRRYVGRLRYTDSYDDVVSDV